MKTSMTTVENPFLGKLTIHRDYQFKFIIALANSDILSYSEKRKKKKL